jgi:hypothetical protein
MRVEGVVDPRRSARTGCRPRDLPHWIAPSLYELELDGEIVDHMLKVVAPRGRFTRRIRRVERRDTRVARADVHRAGAELAAASPRALPD